MLMRTRLLVGAPGRGHAAIGTATVAAAFARDVLCRDVQASWSFRWAAKTHAGRLLAKLQARDRTKLDVVAYETGLVIPGGA